MSGSTKLSEYRSLVVVGLWLLAGIMLFAGCQDSTEEPSAASYSTDGAQSDIVRNGVEFFFTGEDYALVEPNEMHIIHDLDDRAKCNDCHNGARNIAHTEAHKYCIECHEDSVVTDPVWQNHCLACHHFTEADTKYAEDNGILQDLCVECHEGEQIVHQTFGADSSHNISCENCHAPHETSLVFGGQQCNECHADIVAMTDEDTRVHGSCLVCHTPHSGVDEIEQYCTKCHFASADILVHNVPDHPKDCLACHKAHFSSTEIGDESCLVCHDDTYYGGESNLPAAHRDCENCHYTGNFNYRGDKVCADCHEHEGHVISEADLPPEHAHCSTCHSAHHWYSTFEQTCDNCHDLSSIIEHNLSFHQHECNICHDPHTTSTMTITGHCSGCHEDPQYPDFKPATVDEHLQCENCHDQVAIDSRSFAFTGPADSCMVCHMYSDPETGEDWSNVPYGHQVCNVCHSAHEFDNVNHSQSCDLCHVDIYAKPPNMAHAECFNCHESNHHLQFLGQDMSCELCHMDAVAGIAAIDGHPTDCDTCHSVHGELATTDSCEMCHFELPGLHATAMFFADSASQNCATCHGMHDMVAGQETCAQCHEDDHTREEPNCLECHSFRE